MGDDEKTRRYNDLLSRFLASFPTRIHCTANKLDPRKQVFWSEKGERESSSSKVHEKIKSAFGDIYLSSLKGVLQFWAPLKTSCGRLILSTSNQPFSFAYLNTLRHKYRLSSLSYHSTILDDYTESKENPMIITGPPAITFLNRFPVVLDLSVHQHDPLVRSALECGLTYSLLLPVFIHPSQTASSRCVGVVECSVKRSGLVIFNQLKIALERVGLTIYNVQDYRPYKSLFGLKHATNEIEEALEIVCESHDLALAQVWIAYENDKPVPFSSSVEDSEKKEVCAFKLIGYRDASDDRFWSPLKDYYDNCDMLDLEMGEGLVGKALLTYQPQFCRNTYKLTGDSGLLAVLSANTRCSCFTICLRSLDTGDVDYVFEFLWPRSRNHLILLESLLSTLKSNLPSFKLASGVQLGNELHVLDVENSTRNGNSFFKTLQGNRLSRWKKCSNVLGIPEWQGPKFLKRKLSDLSESQVDINQEDSTANQEFSTNISQKTSLDDNDDVDDDDVLVAATYRDKFKVFLHPFSSTIADVKEKIAEEFSLDPGSYRLQFEINEGNWATLNNDQDFAPCIDVCRRARMCHIEVRVLPSTDPPQQKGDMQSHSKLRKKVLCSSS